MKDSLAPSIIVWYAAALGAVSLALGLRLVLQPILGQEAVFILFAPAVLIVALYGGIGPGLFATALGAFAADYFVLEPRFTLKLHEVDDQISTLLFVLASGSIVWVSERHRRADAERRHLVAEVERSRQRLQESEAHYARLAAAVPGILFTTGEDGSYDYLNPHYYDYAALPPGSGTGLGWAAALHPEDMDAAKHRWTESIQTGHPSRWNIAFAARMARIVGSYAVRCLFETGRITS